jgi:hypothetical protein
LQQLKQEGGDVVKSFYKKQEKKETNYFEKSKRPKPLNKSMLMGVVMEQQENQKQVPSLNDMQSC